MKKQWENFEKSDFLLEKSSRELSANAFCLTAKKLPQGFLGVHFFSGLTYFTKKRGNYKITTFVENISHGWPILAE